MISTSKALSSAEKSKLVTSIRASKTFSNATTSSALLQYLCKASLENQNLKESVIEMEFFGNAGDIDRNNPRVRVNVYNLRKKLNQYYEKEGVNDKWRVEIEKGQYSVEFIQEKKEGHRRINLKQLFFPSVCALLLVCLLFQIQAPNPSPIWTDIVEDNQHPTLYIGDAYGFMGKTASGRWGWNRDYRINSEQELKNYLVDHNISKYKIETSHYNYMTKMGALGTQALSQYFSQFQSTFQIQFATETTLSEIGRSNSIYIGPTQTKPAFVHLFNIANPTLRLEHGKLHIRNNPQMQDTIIEFTRNYGKSEYALVSKINGPQQTKAMLFLSNHDMGVTKLVHYFTSTDSLEAFDKTYHIGKENFTALFEISGLNRTATSSKCLFVVN